jgi:hypothetical protein
MVARPPIKVDEVETAKVNLQSQLRKLERRRGKVGVISWLRSLAIAPQETGGWRRRCPIVVGGRLAAR